MSIFNITDITPAGAYMNAMSALRESNRRNADRYVKTGEGRNIPNSRRTLVQRIATMIAATRKIRRLFAN